MKHADQICFTIASTCAAALLLAAAYLPARALAKGSEVLESTSDKTFSGSAGLSYRSSTSNPSEVEYRSFLSAKTSLAYSLDEHNSLTLDASGTKDLNRELKWRMTGLVFGYGLGRQVSDDTTLTLSLSYGAPVVADELRYEHSRGSVGAAVQASKNFHGALSGLSLAAGIGYTRYINAYTDNDAGNILMKWQLYPSFTAVYAITQKLSFSFDFTNYRGWDYDGSQQDDQFLHSERLSYSLDSQWSVSVGHINNGLTYDYGGAANNVRAYDKYSSQVFVGSGYRF